MSAEPLAVFAARLLVRKAAQGLTRSGMSPDSIAAQMVDLVRTETPRAIEEDLAWAEKYDADEAADREDFGDECEIEARRERERETGT